jgi:hypothetical protein
MLNTGNPLNESWHLHDEKEAERRKRERVIRLNTVTIPWLRAAGFGLLSLTVLLYTFGAHGRVDWRSWAWLNLTYAAYCAASAYLLHLFFADLRRRMDLGLVFLVLDLFMWQAAVYFTGAERSWLFVLPLFRVIDQTPVSTRRALVFAHLGPLSYVGLLGYLVWAEGRPIAPGIEVGKITFLYLGSLYAALVARSADLRTQRMTQVIRFARQLVKELEQKSEELEASAR